MLLFYYPRFEIGIQNDLVDRDSNHITDSKIENQPVKEQQSKSLR